MISDKDMELLSFLYKKETPISIEELSEHFSLSERSIRYYIDNINFELKSHGILVNKKICTLLDPPFVKNYLQNIQPKLYSGEAKKKFMLYKLSFEGYINLTSIAKELDISRSSVKSYLDEIKLTLDKYHIELTQEHKKGLVLVGTEKNIRKLLLQLLLDYKKISKTQQKLIGDVLAYWKSGIDEAKIHKFLNIIQKESNIVLSDHSYSIMFFSCLIVLIRTKGNNFLASCDNENFLTSCSEFTIIENNMNILMNKQYINHFEVLHITSMLIGSNLSQSNILRDNDWFEHDLLVSKIINLFSKYYNLNLSQDRTLYESLLTHLQPTMCRLLNHIPVSDMDYRLIRQQFPKEYEVMKKVLNELNFFTGENQEQDETALLTLHFKAAINRCTKNEYMRKNILIICSHGYGTSKLLEQQLTDTYEVNVLDCIPLHYLSQYESINLVDTIITTIDSLKSYKKIPILHVHPILDYNDIQLLDNNLHLIRKDKVRMSSLLDAIKKSCTIHDYSDLKKNLANVLQDILIRDDGKEQTLLDILPEENIMLNSDINNWQDAIEASGSLLVNNGYVDRSYKEQMLNSFENYGSYMIIDDGIAIPHAKNEGNVYRTGMTLLVLKNPVDFVNGKKLQIFFSFCSKDNIEHLDSLVAVANLVKETTFKLSINNFKEANQVIDFIKINLADLN